MKAIAEFLTITAFILAVIYGGALLGLAFG